MKKDFDIESLFKNIQLVKLDPAKEEACQERLKNYFAKLEAQERWEEKPEKNTSRPWFAYATAFIVIICATSLAIFLFNGQTVKVRNLVKVVVEKENKTMYISSIDVNLLTRKAIVFTSLKKLVINLDTQRVERVIFPLRVDLSDQEKKLAIEILHKKKISYEIYVGSTNNDKFSHDNDSSGVYFFPEPWKVVVPYSDTVDTTKFDKIKFSSTDTIVRIIGYQYPNTTSKQAFVEIRSEESKGYQTFIIVDLGKKKIVGIDFR